MTKEQFLFQLEQKLLDIPQDERAEAMEYYEDYFNDAGPENETRVMEELGSPEKVAASIKDGLRGSREDIGTVNQPPEKRETAGSYSDRSSGRQQMDTRSKWILILLVAVFTFPVWIGLAGTLFGVLIAVVAVVFALLIAAVALAAAGTVAGVVCVIVGVVRFCTGGFVSGLMTFGVGMLLLAMGCLCIAALAFVLGQVLPWMLRGISNLLHNGSKKRKRVSANE